MTPANSMYGNDLALALFLGLPGRVAPIWGTLQHAWMPQEPFGTTERFSRLWPLLVFSEHNRRAAIAAGMASSERVIAIGDPFLYLAAALASGKDLPPPSPAVLLYPSHHRGEDEYAGVHVQLIAAVKERETAPVTACLHPNEFGNPRIRALYEEAGFRLVTHGKATSPAFLARQHTEIIQHGRVISNNVSTATFHAGALGRAVDIYGTPIGDLPTPEGSEAQRRLQAARWPDLCRDGLAGPAARALAEEELGWSSLREPEELLDILGWRPVHRVRNRLVRRVTRPVDLETFVGTPPTHD